MQLLSKTLFQFCVGPGKQKFTIHAALCARQSHAFEALVYGKFKEAAELYVEWDDIDEPTFISFWEYVYTGDYDWPIEVASGDVSTDGDKLLEKDADNNAVEKAAPAVEEPPQNDWITSCKPKKKKRVSKQEMMWIDFKDSWCSELPTPVVNHGSQPSLTHGDILIHHAKVYILGDRYDMTRLMSLSFRKIHQALVLMDFCERTHGDFIELLRFCYKELVPDRLTRLAVHYATCHVEALWKEKEFKQLVEEYSSLSTALIPSMMLRLN
ncbi:hypothetical protein ED733_004108 [Metarhizium rileyi]|uniref:BTB domain-containing protein n=1 Tax=Metarhizium rileyi (strain RCEF 4871) TaxID=1649241 RepID=A0A5C6GBY0_METRR|nr:hypothetical protein ED733_004108 [Metarhizium rileyi]